MTLVLQPQLDELRPHLPEFDGLVVKGEGLEKRIEAELQQAGHMMRSGSGNHCYHHHH